MSETTKIIQPGNFNPDDHWYDKALNATIHPMVNFFLNLSQKRIIQRYCHLNPQVKYNELEHILSKPAKFFKWSGADLINVTTAEGKRQMVVIENNSCPSGQKSMPLLDDNEEMGGYKTLIEQTFLTAVKARKRRLPKGQLAVLYDKNPMESTGYAQIIADLTGEDVLLAEFYNQPQDDRINFKDGVMHIKVGEEWRAVRACFRYLTQKPWNRLPLHTKTYIFNPTIACIAGGRNKMIAAKAYDYFNGTLAEHNLKIQTPETIWDVHAREIPLIVRRMGGQAVIKIPYSNAGQGVFTIVNDKELAEFIELSQNFNYERYIVQSLIGNYNWSSTSSEGKFYHVGMIPDKKGHTYVADLRMMVSSTIEGIRPICVYARRAAEPLKDEITASANSWAMLGTNLSIKKGENQWGSDTSRLMLTDRRDFNKLGLSLDDLIEAYIQTVLSTLGIDEMCQTLYNTKGKFRKRLFRSLNDDNSLINELLM